MKTITDFTTELNEAKTRPIPKIGAKQWYIEIGAQVKIEDLYTMLDAIKKDGGKLVYFDTKGEDAVIYY